MEAGQRTKKVILDATVNNREKDGIEFVFFVPLSSSVEILEPRLMLVNGSIDGL